MQYILDQAEYDEYMELKTMKEYPLSKPDELMHLLISGKAQWEMKAIDVLRTIRYERERYNRNSVSEKDIDDAIKELEELQKSMYDNRDIIHAYEKKWKEEGILGMPIFRN